MNAEYKGKAMNNKNSDNDMTIEIVRQVKLLHAKSLRDLKSVCDNMYSQIESLTWLQKRLSIKGELPPLRGWPVSPDFLLCLHKYITKEKPKLVVEFGSGASTLVIADALRQNGIGKLISFEHLSKYYEITNDYLTEEFLSPWVELRLEPLCKWDGDHLANVSKRESEKKLNWYPINALKDINGIDLVIVDGPPASTCSYARYPALPALYNSLNDGAQVWMDDSKRDEEKDITNFWSKEYNMDLTNFSLEKGLVVLKK